MNGKSIAMYVDRAGNPPARPVVGVLPTGDPAKLAALLAAIGMEVRPGGAAQSHHARTIGVEWSVVEAAPPPGAKDEKHHFLVDDVPATFERAVAAGAAVELAPRQTSWGFRAIVADADRRRFVLTAARTTVRDVEGTEGGAAVLTGVSTSEARPSSVEGRSSIVHLAAGSLTLIGTGAVIIGVGAAAAGVYAGLRTLPVFTTVSSWIGIALLIVSKLICLIDRGRLVGKGPILAALGLDIVGLGAMGYYRTTGVSNLLADMALHGFLLSLSIYAFYWQEAAGTLRLAGANRLLGYASVGFVTATGCGLLTLLASNRALDIRFLANWGVLGAGAAGVIASALLFAGLAGVTARLFDQGVVRRPSPPDVS